jgi:hypothetical protein
MGGRVAKKHTRCRTWCKFVWSCGGETRIAEAPKNVQVGVIRWLAMKEFEGDMLYGRTWSAV